MEKYIIERILRGTLSENKFYFETVKECTNKEVMNVFEEHITRDKSKAKRFYDKEEAQRFADLFGDYGSSKVIPVKK